MPQPPRLGESGGDEQREVSPHWERTLASQPARCFLIYFIFLKKFVKPASHSLGIFLLFFCTQPQRCFARTHGRANPASANRSRAGDAAKPLLGDATTATMASGPPSLCSTQGEGIAKPCDPLSDLSICPDTREAERRPLSKHILPAAKILRIQRGAVFFSAQDKPQSLCSRRRAEAPRLGWMHPSVCPWPLGRGQKGVSSGAAQARPDTRCKR